MSSQSRARVQCPTCNHSNGQMAQAPCKYISNRTGRELRLVAVDCLPCKGTASIWMLTLCCPLVSNWPACSMRSDAPLCSPCNLSQSDSTLCLLAADEKFEAFPLWCILIGGSAPQFNKHDTERLYCLIIFMKRRMKTWMSSSSVGR